jgi:hypothetical protein
MSGWIYRFARDPYTGEANSLFWISTKVSLNTSPSTSTTVCGSVASPIVTVCSFARLVKAEQCSHWPFEIRVSGGFPLPGNR